MAIGAMYPMTVERIGWDGYNLTYVLENGVPYFEGQISRAGYASDKGDSDGHRSMFSPERQAQLDRKIAHGVKVGYISEWERDNCVIIEATSDPKDSLLLVHVRGKVERRGGGLQRPADEVLEHQRQVREAEKLVAVKAEEDGKTEAVRLASAHRVTVEGQILAAIDALDKFNRVGLGVRSWVHLGPGALDDTINLVDNLRGRMATADDRLAELVGRLEEMIQTGESYD